MKLNMWFWPWDSFETKTWLDPITSIAIDNVSVPRDYIKTCMWPTPHWVNGGCTSTMTSRYCRYQNDTRLCMHNLPYKNYSSSLTSQAVTFLAPALAAIIARSPVPVPISRTWGSLPDDSTSAMAISKPLWYKWFYYSIQKKKREKKRGGGGKVQKISGKNMFYTSPTKITIIYLCVDVQKWMKWGCTKNE